MKLAWPVFWKILVTLGLMKKTLLLLLLIVPNLALAEVMDKEVSLAALFAWGAASAIAIFLTALFKPRLLLLVAIIPMLFVWGQLSEVTDKFVGPDILKEAGTFYVTVSWTIPWVLFASLAAGLYLRRRKAQPINPADALRRG